MALYKLEESTPLFNLAASAHMLLPVQRDDLLRDCSFCGFKGVVISTATLQVTWLHIREKKAHNEQ